MYNRYSKPRCLIQSGGIFTCNFNNVHNQDRDRAFNKSDVDKDDQTREPSRTPNQAPNVAFEPEYSAGDFIMFEQAGGDNLIDDDVRNMI